MDQIGGSGMDMTEPMGIKGHTHTHTHQNIVPIPIPTVGIPMIYPWVWGETNNA